LWPFGIFLRPWNRTLLYILWPFGVFCVYLVYTFGIFFLFWYVVPRKIWQRWSLIEKKFRSTTYIHTYIKNIYEPLGQFF
jgi:ABC-type long-subunit fatty acid transport system fused permease/ATPase subunit